ncbi:MAG: glycosyltransferase family 2 protein [bacterium]|nr:glycosyltransferase family 2 protein [bacterium]
MKRVAIVIPAYNEERFISKTTSELKSLYEIPVLIVDDGSKDSTYEKALKLADVAIRHEKNKGKGKTLLDGVHEASKISDYALLMDADYQHLPTDVKNFIYSDYEKYDIIVGKRDMSLTNMPLLRYLTNRTTTLIVSLLAGRRTYDSQSGFRMVRIESFLKIPITTFRFQMESEMLIKAGRLHQRIGFVNIKTVYGDEVSKIDPFKDTLRFIKMALEALWA